MTKNQKFDGVDFIGVAVSLCVCVYAITVYSYISRPLQCTPLTFILFACTYNDRKENKKLTSYIVFC